MLLWSAWKWQQIGPGGSTEYGTCRRKSDSEIQILNIIFKMSQEDLFKVFNKQLKRFTVTVRLSKLENNMSFQYNCLISVILK